MSRPNPLAALKAHFENPLSAWASVALQETYWCEAKALVDAAVEYTEKREQAVLDLCAKRDPLYYGYGDDPNLEALDEIRALLEKGE